MSPRRQRSVHHEMNWGCEWWHWMNLIQFNSILFVIIETMSYSRCRLRSLMKKPGLTVLRNYFLRWHEEETCLKMEPILFWLTMESEVINHYSSSNIQQKFALLRKWDKGAAMKTDFFSLFWCQAGITPKSSDTSDTWLRRYASETSK